MEDNVFDIANIVQGNDEYRRVLRTTDRTQLVIMSLQPGKDIERETHEGDQIISILQGSGSISMNAIEYDIYPGVVIVIPAGTEHYVLNGKEGMMKLFTIYSPPEHYS